MNYVEFAVSGNEYKLRLGVRDIVSLEEKLKGNPMSIFGMGDRIPTVKEMVTILHASMQKYHHGTKLDKCYEIFEDYLEEASMIDFCNVIMDIYIASGIISNEGVEEAKN